MGVLVFHVVLYFFRSSWPAARRGETKFHDPSRSIYLNTLQRNKSLNGNDGGFMLKNLDVGPGNRLANGAQYDPRYSSGRWSALINVPPPAPPPDDDDQQEPVIIDSKVSLSEERHCLLNSQNFFCFLFFSSRPQVSHSLLGRDLFHLGSVASCSAIWVHGLNEAIASKAVIVVSESDGRKSFWRQASNSKTVRDRPTCQWGALNPRADYRIGISRPL